MRQISRGEARRFLLYYQGLLGPHRYEGREGVLAFTRKAGCVQFDPVNLCGRSPDLTYLSRVKGYEAAQLEDLLYNSRDLLDHFDKNLAIYPKEDWPYLARTRRRYGDWARDREDISPHREQVLALIREKGPQSSAQLGIEGSVDWFWAKSSLSRALLEHLYYEGQLLVHSKKGVIKTYDLAERCLPEHIHRAGEPNPDEGDYLAWHLLRRVRAIGFLWNRASDALLGSPLWYREARERAFKQLIESGQLLPLRVEGIRETLYLAAADEGELDAALAQKDAKARCELIAPLDSFIWDRRLIEALFGFRYTWEIYTPPKKRVYGPYVLPVLYGDALIGRAAPVCDRKTGLMSLTGLWWEEGVKPGRETKKALEQALDRLAAFNGCRAGRAK